MNELVKALRCCALPNGCLKCDLKDTCPECHVNIMRDAADAIEELQKDHTLCSDMLKLALRVTGLSMSALVQIYQIEQKERENDVDQRRG